MSERAGEGSRVARTAAALAAFDAYLARRRADDAEPLAAWLAAHAHLGDALDEVVLSHAVELEAADAPPAPTPRAAENLQLGDYTLLEQLGAGAHGAVWRARDDAGGEVAVKVLHAHALADGDLRARFRREARVAEQFEHPALCRVLAFDSEGPRPWLAMPLVAGTSLAQRLAQRRGAVTEREGARFYASLVEQLALGLHAAHEQGLVHRDVKPSNILVTPHDAPVLIDFGVVREASSAGQLTMTGDRMGTPAYMAPEQLAGAAVDRRADVWALGAVLFECLAGRPPFVAPTHEAIARAVTHDPLPRLRELAPVVPRALALVVEVALAKHPRDRYATAQDLAEDLRRFCVGAPLRARRSGPLRRAWRWAGRNLVLSAVLGLLLLACLAAGGASWLAWRSARTARAQTATVAYQAARSEAQSGHWQDALRLLQQAEELGHDAVEVALARIEVWDATSRTELSRAALAELSDGRELGKHRALVEIMHHDFSRQVLAGGIDKWVRGKKAIEAALRAPYSAGLEPAWREYAQALICDRLPVALEHVERALQHDRRHRAANEMLGPLVLLLRGPNAALQVAKEFQAMYPGDAAAVFQEAAALVSLGRDEDARARAGTMSLPGPALRQLELLQRLRRASRRVMRDHLDWVLQIGVGSRPVEHLGASKLLVNLFTVLGEVLRPSLQGDGTDESEQTAASDMARDNVLFRFPPAAAISAGRAISTLLFVASNPEKVMSAMLEQMPTPGMRLTRHILCVLSGRLELAGELDVDLLAPGNEPFGIERSLGIVVATAWRRAYWKLEQSAPHSSELQTHHKRCVAAIEAVLRHPEPTSALELLGLGMIATNVRAPQLCRHIAAELARKHDTPEAFADSVWLLHLAAAPDAAQSDLEWGQKRWPNHPALQRAKERIDKELATRGALPERR